MFNQQKRGKTAAVKRRNMKQETNITTLYDSQNQNKKSKNSIRAKAEKKKEEKLAKQTKKIHVSYACFDKLTKKLCIALVDCEIRIYTIKESGKRIKLEENPLSFRSKDIVTYMEISRFVVNDRLILIAGTDIGTIEIYYLDEVSNENEADRRLHEQLKDFEGFQIKKRDVRLTSTLMRHFAMDKEKDLQTIKLKYARDVGLIVCALNDSKAKGILNFFDSVDFKHTCNYEDDIIGTNQEKYRINITCMDYSENNNLIALGGTEGNIIIID